MSAGQDNAPLIKDQGSPNAVSKDAGTRALALETHVSARDHRADRAAHARAGHGDSEDLVADERDIAASERNRAADERDREPDEHDAELSAAGIGEERAVTGAQIIHRSEQHERRRHGAMDRKPRRPAQAQAARTVSWPLATGACRGGSRACG